MATTSKPSTPKPNAAKPAAGFSAEERAAMKQRAAELRAEARSAKGAQQAADDAAAVLAKIAAMAQPDRGLAERIHSLVLAAAPNLAPKVWYGQPGYAKDGKLVCFFRSGLGDKERYSTFGFSSNANLDDEGGLWPTSYALTELTDAGAAALSELVARAAR
jgi:uncharacterized protein YdhG (YjbR/CyaY superfamily)